MTADSSNALQLLLQKPKNLSNNKNLGEKPERGQEENT